MKFPSQAKLMYESPTLGNDAYTSVGYLNLPKDLSIVNRRGYASTDGKGHPFVFRCKVDLYLADHDGAGISAAVGSDFNTTLKIEGCQNNWVMMQAAKKWHAAREAMFSQAGIPSKQRGAYSKEIRYTYAGATDAFMSPLDGNGDAFTGGTWDVSNIVTHSDVNLKLKLTGLGLNEETTNTATALNIGHSYLMSRMQPQFDSNAEAAEGPADASILRSLLAPRDKAGISDDINAEARDAQDNPPYELIDLSDSGSVNHDITEPVELGRAVAGLGNTYGSVIVDIPFGIANLTAVHFDAVDTNITDKVSVCVEVLDIYPMQG
jgi:hypothetical protein